MNFGTYQFDILPAAGQSSRRCLDAVRDEVVRWVRCYFSKIRLPPPPFKFNALTKQNMAGHEIRTVQLDCASHRLTSISWTLPEEPELGTSWYFDCVLACDNAIVQVVLQVQLRLTRFVLRGGHVTMGPSNPLLWLPDLLERIVRTNDCRIESQPVPRQAIVLRADQVEGFVRETLLSPARVLPVVLLGLDTPTALVTLASCNSVQKRLLGLAQVAAFFDSSAVARLTQLLGPERSCQGGTRTYWPGFNLDIPPAQSPLHPWAKLREMLGKHPFELWSFEKLAGLAATCFREGPVIGAARDALLVAWADVHRDAQRLTKRVAEVEQAKKSVSSAKDRLNKALTETKAREQHWRKEFGLAKERLEAELAAIESERGTRQKQVKADQDYQRTLQQDLSETQTQRERFRQEASAATDRVHSLETELTAVQAELLALRDVPRSEEAQRAWDELGPELQQAWDENAHLRNEWEAARQRIVALEAELRYFKNNWELLRQAPAPPPDPTPIPEPVLATVADALRAAGAQFDDILVIWEEAFESAAESQYASPATVYRALQALAEVGRAYFAAQQGGPPLGPVDQAIRRRVPFKYAPGESPSTLSQFGTERVFHHRDESRQMVRHLTIGGGNRNNCLQIYFDFDLANGRVLIGDRGRHLTYRRQRT